MPLLVDRVKMVVLSSGTGAFQLGGAVPSFRGIEALVDGASYRYAASFDSNYEIGNGTYVAGSGTMVREPVLSSAGNAAVNFPANIELSLTAFAQDYGSGAAADAGAEAGAIAGATAGENAANDVLSGIYTSFAAPTGGTLVGVNDGSGGSIFTTLQGFVTKLLSNTGAAVIGFIQAGTGAVTRNLQVKLRDDYVTPGDFGAAGDGVTDDYAALLAALQSGKPCDGKGKTYALSDQVQPSTFSGFYNATLKWVNTGAMAQQKALLSILDLSNWYIDMVNFDMGTVTNTGSANDSTRFGLKVTTSNPNVTFNDNVSVTRCRAFGNGNGTGLFIRNCRRVVVRDNIVRDRQVSFSPDPSNDCQNGIDVSQCVDASVVGNRVFNLKTSISGVFITRFSRGMLFFETRDSTVNGNIVDLCDQNFDFSGAVDAVVNTNGNVGLTVTGNVSTNARTYGFKFANVARDCVVTGNIARRFGYIGFVFSGSSPAPFSADRNTQRILVSGNFAFDPTGEFTSNCFGFGLLQQPSSTGYPRGIKLVGNFACDTSGGGKLQYGFYSEVVYDGSSGVFNEEYDNRSQGHTTAGMIGFQYFDCRVRRSSDQSITNANPTAINFNNEDIDTSGMHDNVTNSNQIRIPVTGYYTVQGFATFAANATGFRRAQLRRNGSGLGAANATAPAVSGSVTTVSTPVMEFLFTAADVVDMVCEQNSGGALNVVGPDTSLQVMFVRPA